MKWRSTVNQSASETRRRYSSVDSDNTIKLGSHAIDDAAASLRTLVERRIARPPKALAVITSIEYAYRRPDGVDVIPLAALKP